MLTTTEPPTLTTKQLTVLTYFYSYRFLTTLHLQQLSNLSNQSSAYRLLQTLLERGLIYRNYSPNNRLQNKPAIYNLTGTGITTLRTAKPQLSPQVLHNLHRDSTATEAFKHHCLAVIDIALRLKDIHGPGTKFVTASELMSSDYVIRPVPAGYIILPNGQRLFIDLFPSPVMQVAVRHRTRQYLDYFTKGEWEYATGIEFPQIIYVCDTPRQKYSLNSLVTLELDRAFEDDLSIKVLTYDEIRSGSSSTE